MKKSSSTTVIENAFLKKNLICAVTYINLSPGFEEKERTWRD